MVVTWGKKRKKQRNRNFPLYFKNGKLYGADIFFFFLKSSDNFPLETCIKQNQHRRKFQEKIDGKKTFVSLAAGLANPSTRGTKVFCINFYRACFLHWRVETSGKLKAKDQSWCGNKKKMVVTWGKKRKKQRNRNFPLYFKNGKLYGADIFFFFFEKFRQFSVRNMYKTKINVEEISKRKLTEKNFCAVSGRARRPVNSRHKSFLYKFQSRFFLHWRVETSGKLKAKDQSWCGNKKKNGGHMRKKKK